MVSQNIHDACTNDIANGQSEAEILTVATFCVNNKLVVLEGSSSFCYLVINIV
jgi:hypothetical protein